MSTGIAEEMGRLQAQAPKRTVLRRQLLRTSALVPLLAATLLVQPAFAGGGQGANGGSGGSDNYSPSGTGSTGGASSTGGGGGGGAGATGGAGGTATGAGNGSGGAGGTHGAFNAGTNPPSATPTAGQAGVSGGSRGGGGGGGGTALIITGSQTIDWSSLQTPYSYTGAAGGAGGSGGISFGGNGGTGGQGIYFSNTVTFTSPSSVIYTGGAGGNGGAGELSGAGGAGGNGILFAFGTNSTATISTGTYGGAGGISSTANGSGGQGGSGIAAPTALTLTLNAVAIGGDGGSNISTGYGGEGGRGIDVGSLYGTINAAVTGGQGGNADGGQGGGGGNAINVGDGNFTIKANVTGGDSGNSAAQTNGGAGILSSPATLSVTIQNNAIVRGGNGGTASAGAGIVGGNGIHIASGTSTISVLSGQVLGGNGTGDSGTSAGGMGIYVDYHNSTTITLGATSSVAGGTNVDNDRSSAIYMGGNGSSTTNTLILLGSGGTTGQTYATITGDVIAQRASGNQNNLSFAGAGGVFNLAQINLGGGVTTPYSYSGFTNFTVNAPGGTWIMTGASTQTGGASRGNWTVSGGTLQLGNSTTAGKIFGLVTVNNTGVLSNPSDGSRTATIDSTLNVNSGGALSLTAVNNAPALNVIGTGLTLASGSSLNITLGAPTTQALITTVSATLNGTLNITNSGSMAAGAYVLVSYANSMVDNGLTIGTAPSEFQYQIDTTTISGQVLLIVSGVSTSLYWNGTTTTGGSGPVAGGTGTWTAAASGVTNWTNAAGTSRVVSDPAVTAIFAGTAGTVTVDVSSGAVSAKGLQFETTGYTIAGAALTLVNGSTMPQVNVVGAATTATISAPLAGSNGLEKIGDGTLVLSGANTYTGNTTLTAGTLTVSGSGTLGGGSYAGALSLASGTTFNYGSSAAQTLSGNITGAGGLSVSGTGTLTLSGTNTYGGATSITGGTLVASGSSIGDSSAVTVASGGTLSVTFNETIGSLAGAGTVDIAGSKNLTLGGDNSSTTFSGVLSDGGTVTKAGTGTWTLTGTNTLTGVVRVTGGKLVLAAGSSASSASMVAIDTGTTLELTGGPQTLKSLVSITAGGGTVQLNANTLTIGANNRFTFSGTITGTGGVTTGNTAYVTLSGTNTFTGPFQVGTGEATLSGGSAIADNVSVTVASGGVLTLANSETIGSLSGAGNVEDGGTAVTLTTGGNNTSTTFSGTFFTTGFSSGTSSLVKTGTGTFTLTGNSSYSGGTTISGGTLQLGNGGTTGSITGNITNNAALIFNRSNDISYSGTISGTGTLQKAGDGTLTFAGTNSSTGLTTVSAGTLALTGGMAGSVTVSSGATLAGTSTGLIGGTLTIASGATLTATSGNQFTAAALSLASGSTINLTANTPTTTTAVNVTGSLTLDGTLDITAGNAFGTGTYRLFNYGSLTNNGLVIGTAPAHNLYQLSTSTPGQVNLIVAAGQWWNGSTTASGGSAVVGGSGTWDVAAATTNWTNAGGSSADAWGQGGLALFGGTGGTVTVSGSTTPQVAGMEFLANGYVVTGGPITLTAFATGATPSIMVDSGISATINSVLSGSNGLTKTGDGTLILTRANSYSGTTTITAGTLQVGDGGTTGSLSGSVVSNSALVFNRSDDFTFAGDISGTGTVEKLGAGTLTLTGTTTASTFNVTAGTLALNGSSASNIYVKSGATLRGNNINVNGGSVTVESSGTLATYSGNALFLSNVTLTSGAIVAYTAGNPASGTGISALGSLTLDGTLNVTAGAGFTTGTYRVFSYIGTFTDNGFAIGTAPAHSLYRVDTSTSGQVNLIVAAGQWWNGSTTTSGGSAVVGGSGTWDVAAATTNWTNAGGSSADAWGQGSLAVFAGTGGTVTVGGSTAPQVAGMEFLVDGYTVTSGSLTLAAFSADSAPSIRVESGVSATISSNLTGTAGLNKTGDGTLIISGLGAYSGGTTITAGTLQLGNGGNSGGVAGDILNNGTLVINRANTATFSGVVSGTGSVTQAGSGTVILTGENTYTGASTVLAGTLQIGNGGTTGSIAGAIANSGTVVFDHSNDITAAGAITGSGALVQQGGGKLTLTGANSAAGGTTVSAGTLEILSGVTLASNITVGSGGTLQGETSGTAGAAVNGTVTVQNGGTILAAPTSTAGVYGLSMTGLTLSNSANVSVLLGANTGVGVLQAGNLTLDGILNISASGSMALGVYRLIDYTTLVADNGLVLGTTPSQYAYTIDVVPNHVNLNVLSGDLLYWNGSTTTPDGTVHGGAGTWSTSTPAPTNWLTSPLNQSVAWNSQFAVFAGTAGAVTVSGTVSTTGMQFMVDGYSLTSGTITLAATSGQTQVRVGDGSGAGASYKATIGSVLTGTTGLEKTDLGTLILTGNNTYTGGTTVTAGTLQIGDGGSTGSIGGDVAVASGATLAFNREDSLTVSGVISGAGGLTQAGSGTLTLTGNNTYTGTTTISSGVLFVGNGGTSGGLAGDVVNNGTLRFDRSDNTSYAGAISGTGTLTKESRGTLTLSGTNSFTGATQVNGGTLALSGGSSLADGARLTVASAGTLSLLDSNETVGSLDGRGTVMLGSHTLTVGGDGTDSTYYGEIRGTGGLTKTGAGTLTLTVPNYYTGLTTVSAGTLVIQNEDAIADGNSVSVAAGAILDLQMTGTKTFAGLSGAGSVNMNAASLSLGWGGATSTFSGVLSGTGGLWKKGDGTLTLSGVNTYTGITTVNYGTLLVDGSVAGDVEVQESATLAGTGSAAGTVHVLSGGILAGTQPTGLTMGGLNMDAGANMNVTLGAPSGSGVFTVNGNVTLDGTLNVTQNPGFGIGIYRLASYTGTLTDNGLDVAPLSGGLLGGVQTSVAGQVNLLVESAGNPILFWNGPNTTATQTVEGGSGTWKASSQTNWINSSGTIAQDWNGNFAVFEGTAGTVTVDAGNGAVSATGMQFATSGYVVTGATLTLAGTGPVTIRVGDGTGAGAAMEATIASVLAGSVGMIKTDLGTLILSGANTYTGGTTISAGTLQIGNGGTTGSITGDVVNNAALVFSRSDPTSFGGVISGTGAVTQLGSGELSLTGANTYSGGTTIGAGTLRIASAQAVGSGAVTIDRGATLKASGTFTLANNVILSNVVSAPANAAISVDAAQTMVVSGVISGGGALDKTGAGTLILTGTNTYTGSTTISAGTLQIGNGGTMGSVLGNIVNNAALVFNRSDAYTFTGTITGPGSVTFTGGGTVAFSAPYTGAVAVDDSAVKLVSGTTTSSLFTVNTGGVLGGTASIGGLIVNAGGTAAPGYSPGTLTVNGPVTFNSGGVYAVDITPQGAHDLIIATGNVTLSSGASVAVSASEGRYARSGRVTILTTAGTVTGTFGTVTSDYAFITPSLSYDAQNVYLNFVYNGVEFVDYALTPNQTNVAVAAQGLGEANPAYQALYALAESQVAPALNQLTGEIYPSVSTVIQQESVYLRDAVGARLRQSVTDSGTGALSYAAKAAGPATAALSQDLTPTLWMQGYGAWGDAFGNGNAASISSSVGGFFAGLDAAIAGNVRAGIVAGFSQTQLQVNARGSTGSMDNYDVGFYLGGQFGALGLRGGASYSWHDIQVNRTVAFPGFSASEKGGYTVGTTQLFGEAGYRIGLGAYELEPFAGLAYVNVSGGSTSETGTNGAGLGVDVQGMSTLYTTLGARAATTLMLGGRALTPSATLGWQHAFGDTTPTAGMQFLAGSTPFQVQGVPIAEDTLLVGAGLAYALSDLATIQVNYSGQLATTASQNAFSAQFSLKF